MARWFSDTTPRVVVNCAAFNAVDDAESNEDRARQVNAIAVGRLAALCAGVGARFITFSTNYVFDGEKTTGYVESDVPSPLSAYGRSKLEGESLALDNDPGAVVIRTSALLSSTHRSFARVVLEAVANGPMRVVDDEVTCPTNVDDLARATVGALDTDATGILHLVGGEAMSWFELATRVVVAVGLSRDLVIPVAGADYPRPALRPKNSVLSSERCPALGLSPLAPISATLADLVTNISRW
jgi:dTDP-4-dehydrorhamnose reductase